jgi:hypothetical protein
MGRRTHVCPQRIPDTNALLSLSLSLSVCLSIWRDTSLCACTPHYIRCIKPNANKRPGEWSMELCLNQIKYLGLLENVRVRRAGYAFRLPFGHFLRR